MRVYTHLMPASEDRARQAIDAAFACVPAVSQGVRYTAFPLVKRYERYGAYL